MRALLSVYDKTGLVPFAAALHDLGYELVSTGGSARTLTDAGLQVTSVDEVTGFPEILDGRVKTLHPHIHGGLLAQTSSPSHMATLAEHGITPFDILVSNLYPFEAAAADPAATVDDKIEMIDIGGPAMVRAAAKNHASVIVVTNPSDYETIVSEIATGPLSLGRRRQLAAQAFGHVSVYDALVASFLGDGEPQFPDVLTIPLRRSYTPRYGENPHQQAAAYVRLRSDGALDGLLGAEVLIGDALSFNNLLDADAAWNAAQLFDEPTVAIVKHMVPCGLATRASLTDAYEQALAGDPVSAYGGIVALNRDVDLQTASLMRKLKLDIIIAPSFQPDALASLARKKGTRIVVLANRAEGNERKSDLDVRPISGGMLVQEPDVAADDPLTWNVVTQRAPCDSEWADLAYAWQAVRLVKSNAIVFARERAIVGLGAGQPNRLESVTIAARKASTRAHGAAMASDAFFPFADGIEQAISSGVTAVIQPGGSMRDDEVIAAANEHGIAMVFTGTRHFRH